MKSNNPPINEEVACLLKFASAGKTTGKITDKNDGRSDMFPVVVEFLERRHTELTKNQLSLMSDILTRLVRDVAMNVRQKLANRLARDNKAPVDLIILLANDQIEVAEPVLSLNGLLSDDDLIEIIRHKTIQHQLAITARDQLSARICHELITISNNKTLVMLLTNPQARINDESFSLLVEKSKDNLPLQPPLIDRPDLPTAMAAKMYQWVSDNLKQSILANFHLSKADIDHHVSAAMKEASTEDENRTTQEKSEILLVDKLYKADRLKPSFLMKSLLQGQSSLFEISFSRMIFVTRKIMRTLLYDRDTKTLAVVCCAAGIDRSVFMTIYHLTRKAKNLDPALTDDEIAEILEYYRKLDKNTALATIQQWVRQTTPTP